MVYEIQTTDGDRLQIFTLPLRKSIKAIVFMSLSTEQFDNLKIPETKYHLVMCNKIYSFT